MTLASNGKKKELPRQVPGYKPNPLCKKHKPETGGRIKSNEILNHDSRNAKYNYNWDAAVKLMKDWRDNGGDGNYLGMELVYNTIPGIRPVITQNKWSEMNDLDGAFCAGDLCRPSKPCPVSLELDAVSQFIADEMYLSSNHNNLLCHDGGPNHEAVSSMRVKIEYEAEHGWVTYSDSTGKEEFDCTRSASNCTVAMMPPMQAKKARLYMWCPHFNSTAYAKQRRERGKQPVVGFADHTGTKVSLKIQLKTSMNMFGWNPFIQDVIKEIVQGASPLNCSKVLNNCALDAHFTQWVVPNSGVFAQDPPVGNVPIVVTMDASTHVNVTVSKKRLITPRESIIEKRMICFQKHTTPEECCVTKQLLGFLGPVLPLKHATAAARLKNF